MTNPNLEPVRLTEAQWKTLTNLAAQTVGMRIPPITRRWLLRAQYMRPNPVQPPPKGLPYVITDAGRSALANCIKAWILPS
jgi:hypothetical protein